MLFYVLRVEPNGLDAHYFSDIPTLLECYFYRVKVIFKPLVSVILYLFLKLAAGEYHCPKGNITYEVNITCSVRNKYN